MGTNACPTVTATPKTVKAAFTRKMTSSRKSTCKYINPILNFKDRKLFAFQMFEASRG